MSDTTLAEITAIQTAFTNFQTEVAAKVAALDAQIAAQPSGISPAAQTALDALKAAVTNAQVPA